MTTDEPGVQLGYQCLDVVRIKLGPDRAAPQPDPLGRKRIGCAADLPLKDLWDRGRGVWKMKAQNVVGSDLALIVFDGVVRLVGTVEGLTIHDDRLAITGKPIRGHSLVGQPDELHNKSQNPVAYGKVRVPVFGYGGTDEATEPMSHKQ